MSEYKWKTAIYLRYSDKEDGKAESGSIDTQRSMLHHYIDQHDDLEYVAEYVDDDYTGTNFNRPGFKAMKKDCLAGRIQCILVKDHSRFARKSARMQLMLEEELEDIRYISKDDNFDSRRDDYDIIFQFKNLFNEAYAQDISRKVHSAIDDKQRAGKFIGSFACYGYRKDPQDKNRLLIDEEAAEVVRKMFRLRLEGTNVATIARILNAEGILSPYAYKISKGSNFASPTATATGGRYLWNFTSINKILRCQTYAGNLVQGRKRQKMRNKPKKKPKDEWVIVPNSVPAIVSQEEFDQVQYLLDNAKSIVCDHKGTPHMFAGLLHCGECGRTLVKSIKSDNEALYYACSTRKHSGKQFCDLEYIRADVLQKIILNDINEMIRSVHNLENLIKSNEYKFDKNQEEKKRKEKRKSALKAELLRRYKHFDEELISREMYLMYKTQIESQIQAIETELAEWDKESDKRKETVDEWCQRLLKMHELESLDRETVQETVSSITVYKGRKIVICYKYDVFRTTLEQYTDGRAN